LWSFTWSVVISGFGRVEGVGSPLEIVIVGSDRVPLQSGSAMW
jgi:hypothetical protein